MALHLGTGHWRCDSPDRSDDWNWPGPWVGRCARKLTVSMSRFCHRRSTTS